MIVTLSDILKALTQCSLGASEVRDQCSEGLWRRHGLGDLSPHPQNEEIFDCLVLSLTLTSIFGIESLDINLSDEHKRLLKRLRDDHQEKLKAYQKEHKNDDPSMVLQRLYKDVGNYLDKHGLWGLHRVGRRNPYCGFSAGEDTGAVEYPYRNIVKVERIKAKGRQKRQPTSC